jgi:hypothetical protein
MKAYTRNFIWAAFVAVVASACAGGYSSGAGSEPEVSGDSIVVEVRNQNFYDASIRYAWNGQTERRLGDVTGNSRRRFTIRWQPAMIRFNINFIGSGRTTTDEISVEQGDMLGLTIPPDAHRRRVLRIR